MTPSFLSLLMIGAMIPFLFSALTMRAVGVAAQAMMVIIREDLKNKDKEGYSPNYKGCIQIALNSSLLHMILPGLLVITLPIIIGVLLGPVAVSGLLIGIIITGIQMAISASNSGGAWDNTKKLIKSKIINF
jgi:Na+/H+-translocating membrane pyrophosphatase